MIGGVTRHVLPHLPGVPHLLVNRPLVLHFSGVWERKKTDKLGIISHFSPNNELFVILYLVLHFSELWKCEKSDTFRIFFTLFPGDKPLVILYLISSTLTVSWNVNIAQWNN